MKKWMFYIIIVSILSVLFAGCTTVGAVNLPADSNDDKKQIENIPKNITDDKVEDVNNKYNEEKINTHKDIIEEVKAEENNIEVNYNTDEPVDILMNENKENIEEPKSEFDNEIVNIKPVINYFGDNSKMLVALTFDDGPESTYTSQILDILNEYGIKATFFVLGQSVEKYPEVLIDIYEKGHEIGNHSWSHKYFPKISKVAMEKEIIMTEKIIIETIGEYSPIFRPPYGALQNQGKELISSLGYNIVNWSVDTRDWAGTSGDQMMKYVEHQLKPGGIILMHNSGNTAAVKNTVEVLPRIIEWITEQGYEFVTVSEILNL